jgi:hypothetical protein
MASVLGCELSLGIHAIGAPIRDKAHVALLARFAARLSRLLRWRTEVSVPLPGDLRSADGMIDGVDFDAIVEAETRLDDIQAVERRLRAKQRRPRREAGHPARRRHAAQSRGDRPTPGSQRPIPDRDTRRAARPEPR